MVKERARHLCDKRKLHGLTGRHRAIGDRWINLRSMKVDRVAHVAVIGQCHVHSLPLAHMENWAGNGAVKSPGAILHATRDLDVVICRDKRNGDRIAGADQWRQHGRSDSGSRRRGGKRERRDGRRRPLGCRRSSIDRAPESAERNKEGNADCCHGGELMWPGEGRRGALPETARRPLHDDGPARKTPADKVIETVGRTAKQAREENQGNKDQRVNHAGPRLVAPAV